MKINKGPYTWLQNQKYPLGLRYLTYLQLQDEPSTQTICRNRICEDGAEIEIEIKKAFQTEQRKNNWSD